MKSLISNYLNSRRLNKLEETNQDVNDDNQVLDKIVEMSSSTDDIDTTTYLKSIPNIDLLVVEDNSSTNKTQTNNNNSKLENRILKLDLKYIDDNDTDSASITSISQNENENSISDCEDANNNKKIKIIDSTSTSSSSSESSACSLLSSSSNRDDNNQNIYSNLNESTLYSKPVVLIDQDEDDDDYENHYKTCQTLISSLDKLNDNIEALTRQHNYQKLIANDQDLNKQFKFKRLNFNRQKIKYNERLIINQVKSYLWFINNVLLSYHSSANNNTTKNMNNNNNNSKQSIIMEQETNEIESLSSPPAPLEPTNENLLMENKVLKERIKLLEEKLNNSGEQDLTRLKEAFEIMRTDRKRLKFEKIELLNQVKDLYKTIELKENQIKDMLKSFETKTKETSLTVKKLIDGKVEMEKERNDLHVQLVELIEQQKDLNLKLESKNAIINKLQKQIYDAKSKSPRYSLGKDSDYGYSSSKSRDTLSSSMIETNIITVNNNVNLQPPTTTTTTNKTELKTSFKQKVKKEERSLKCKSNDSYIYIKHNQLNDTSNQHSNNTNNNTILNQSMSNSKTNQKLKTKFKLSTMNRLNLSHNSSSLNTNLSNNFESNINTSKSNNNLSFIMSTSDYETDLNKVLDSDEFIDLDDNQNQDQKIKENKINLNQKLISDKNDQKSSSTYVSSCSSSSTTSSSILFANANTTNLKQLEISSSTTLASVSPSSSLTSSSTSSYKNDHPQTITATTTTKVHPINATNIINNNSSTINKPVKNSLILNISGDSESSSSDLSPLLMSQSITLCEEENMFNKTSNDFSNTTRYSIKQPLSMSMSMHTPSTNVKSRSSRIINTIIRMSTIGSSLTSSSTSNSINRSSTVIDNNSKSILPTSYSSTLSSSKVHVDRSLDFSLESNSKNLLNKSFKIHDQLEESFITPESNDEANCLINNSDSIEKWSPIQVKKWLENIGMLSTQIKNSLKYIKNGKTIINMSDSELEKAFMISNHLHKRKLKLAIEDLKNPDKCKYLKLNEITTDWLVNTWLKQIGLVNLQNLFKQNLVDGRVLASLQKKDLEKYLGITKKIHQNSILLAIDLLRKHEFDIQKLKTLRDNAHNENQTLDITLWVNENFIDWLKLVNLHSFVPKLNESGIHGALVADSSFNIDYLFSCLGVDEELKYQNIKKILEDEIKLLKKTKSNMKTDSVFTRPLTSFKHDKQRIFTFRGSLGRALGKKIKRDISSPLIDDDTFKRIEFNHKIVDMKEISNSSAV